jgi:hypothetical protein
MKGTKLVVTMKCKISTLHTMRFQPWNFHVKYTFQDPKLPNAKTAMYYALIITLL